MSSPGLPPDRYPLIRLINLANRAMQTDMVRQAHERGYTEVKQAHNAVFGFLGEHGARASDMAERAGMTRQSMGEIIRDLVNLGILETRPDPTDRRAKVVVYTPKGLELTTGGFQYILGLEEQFAEEIGAEPYEELRAGLERITELVASRGQ
ncbi:MarR family winged helix-turn-helix transcriptional regulator [Aeromicrobium sp.]|uniref:MarR family winged helix-turn-helix transcriptional regulator n=1 Tax=Aeromicrobium sp. TaxID=1871063 RepID=UPI003C69D014